MIVVLDYDDGWPRKFELLRSGLWPAVCDFALTIEHVGSTSVPGLAAKPIIDLDIVVRTPAEIRLAIKRIEATGYRHIGELGIAGREAFRPLYGDRSHNLYLCAESSPALGDHLTFRDYLRAYPEVANAYGDLKKRLAQQFPFDMESYVDGKTSFVLDVLRQAGISPERMAEIRAENTPNPAPESASRA